MGCRASQEVGSNLPSNPPSNLPSQKSTPNPPVPFAIMRNSHEAFRMSIKHALSVHLESGDMVKFQVEWNDFQRAMAVHMEMEDKDMFPLLNSIGG
jgi:hypothetical protein